MASKRGLLSALVGKPPRRKSRGLGSLLSLATGYGVMRKPMKKAWARGIPSLSSRGKR